MPVLEADVLMSLLPGGDIGGLTTGFAASTTNNETVTILGYSSTWKPDSELLKPGESSKQYNAMIRPL